MTRHLLIKAKGGLGNRILSAVGGLIYADLSGRAPVVDWRDGAYAPLGTNAYPLLFDTPLTTPPEAVTGTEDVTPAIWRGMLDAHPADVIEERCGKRHRDPFVYRKLCVDLTRADAAGELAVYWCYLPKFARMRRAMARDPRFRGRSLPEIAAEYLDRYFTPNARVRDGVTAAIPDARRPVLGVHIRYSDLKVPLEKIEAEMARALEREPGMSVFLATDNAEVQARIAARFADVFWIDKWFSADGSALHYNTTAPDATREAENALIDMWALARCDRLIYSGSSTFSYASRLIGGFAPDRARDVDASNPVVMAKRWLRDHA